jgi:hypothetical protein
MNDARSQISRTPGPQRRRQKDQRCANRNDDPRESLSFRTAVCDRWCNEMPHGGSERGVINTRKREPDKINRANDPKPFFELELCCPHTELVAAAVLGCKSKCLKDSLYDRRTMPHAMSIFCFLFDSQLLLSDLYLICD